MCWTCDRKPHSHDARSTRHASQSIFISFCVCVCVSVNNNVHNQNDTWQRRTFSGKLNPILHFLQQLTANVVMTMSKKKNSKIYSNLMLNFIHNSSNYFGSNFHHKTEFYDRHHPATDCYDSKRKKKKSEAIDSYINKTHHLYEHKWMCKMEM